MSSELHPLLQKEYEYVSEDTVRFICVLSIFRLQLQTETGFMSIVNNFKKENSIIIYSSPQNQNGHKAVVKVILSNQPV